MLKQALQFAVGNPIVVLASCLPPVMPQFVVLASAARNVPVCGAGILPAARQTQAGKPAPQKLERGAREESIFAQNKAII
ncbi:MAG TPA: hypothetical protein VGZ29_12115 [Terriglobia bacterium]|nr:hypothetical protein [Terriglobia bacterium]